MNLTDERRKAMFAKKWNQARNKGFNSTQFFLKNYGVTMTPEQQLELSKDIRKDQFNNAYITPEERKLKNKIDYHAKKRIMVSIHGVKPYNAVRVRRNQRLGNEKQVYNHHWENERNAHRELAELQGKKIRDDF